MSHIARPRPSHQYSSRSAVRYALGILVLAAGSVGLQSPPASATQAQNARSTFIDAADTVCSESNSRLVAAAHEYERHTLSRAAGARSVKRKVAKPADVKQFIEEVALKELDATIARLDILQPPTNDRKTYRQLMTDTKKALDNVRAKPAESAWIDPFESVSKRFVAFGFQVCGHPINTDSTDKQSKQK